MNIEAVDLFCGAGGLTHGFESANIKVKIGIDNDPDCQYAYTTNNHAHFLLEDITNINPKDILKHLSDDSILVLAGCAPCQPFSRYTLGLEKKDDRWSLLNQFLRLVQELKPHVITMENVPQLVKHPIFMKFIEGLQKAHYYVSYSVVDCANFGIPQSRKRLVLLASILGDIKLECKKRKMVTVKDAIGALPKINAGEQNSIDSMHVSSKLSNINLERIKQSTQGGTWSSWDKKLIAKCHKVSPTYVSVYGRMSWDKPSPTITTQFYGFGNGRFGHPEQNRAISLREGAILQTFPKSYKFFESIITRRTAGKLIGNAVPVALAKIIAETIKAHVEHQNGSRK